MRDSDLRLDLYMQRWLKDELARRADAGGESMANVALVLICRGLGVEDERSAIMPRGLPGRRRKVVVAKGGRR